jgi:hypothetical protein
MVAYEAASAETFPQDMDANGVPFIPLLVKSLSHPAASIAMATWSARAPR